VPENRFCDRRQPDIFPQVGGQIGRHTGPVPPSHESCGKNRQETALMHGVGDGEFEAQHNAALGEHI
jgi:hypothetical protein